MPRPREIQFSFRGACMRALAHHVDHVHSNVLRLTLIRSTFQDTIAKVFDLLPHCVARLFAWLSPRFTLPSRVIIKTRKPNWDYEFSNEMAMYARLAPLQGRLIPRFLGVATLHAAAEEPDWVDDAEESVWADSVDTVNQPDPAATRWPDPVDAVDPPDSILLSYIDGVPCHEQGPAPLPADEFARRVEAVLWEFTKFGVAYGDTKLDNFLLAGSARKMMVVDLEAVSEESAEHYEIAGLSNKIQARKFDGNGLSEGMPFVYRTLDPNYIPFFCAV